MKKDKSGKGERMLITGASGLVGSYFCRLLDLQQHDLYYDVYVADHTEATNFGRSIEIDLINLTRFAEVIDEVKPDVMVNLAAMTNVDACEVQRDEADRINHLSVKVISEYLDSNNECYLLHVSTDYVFDGERGDYKENSNTNAINWYGMTKLLAEQELLKCNSKNWCIARTSTPFGVHAKKQSFPLFVIKNLSSKQEIKVLTDQITSPTYAKNLAEMLFEIIQLRVKGIIHTSGSSQISRFDQAIKVASIFGLDHNLVKPASINDMNWKARRPKNSSLNVEKVFTIVSKKPMNFEESLSAFALEIGY